METHHPLLETGTEDFASGSLQLGASADRPLLLAYVVVLVCQRGHAQWEINLRPYRIQAQDCLVLSEDTLALVTQASEDFTCTYFLMHRAIAAEVAAALPNSLFAYLSRSPLLDASALEAPFLQAWQSQAQLMTQRDSRYRRTLLVNHLQNLFLWLAEHADAQQLREHHAFSRQETLCWRFWEMVATHCKQHRTVAFYAERLHITPYYLSQLTRRHFNDAPKTLIDRQAVLEIKKQLLRSTHSVQQIAQTMHFTDASYLAKYFRQHTGQGPTEYRKRHG